VQTFATQSLLAYSPGIRCRASSNAAPTAHYMEGYVTSYAGNSLTVNIDMIGGTGTYNDWNLNLAGPTGAGYSATATGAASILVGSVTLTTQTALAYTAGARVRFSAQGSPQNWIEGLVTAYSGTSISAAIDIFGGSGAYSAWDLNLAGQPGQPLPDIDGGSF
jgi:hypothetical protein